MVVLLRRERCSVKPPTHGADRREVREQLPVERRRELVSCRDRNYAKWGLTTPNFVLPDLANFLF